MIRNRRNTVTTAVTVSLGRPSVTPAVTPPERDEPPPRGYIPGMRVRFVTLSPLLLLVALAGCANPNAGFRPPVTSATHADANQGESELTNARVPAAPGAPEVAADQSGLATWYGNAFAGKKTANGERFDPTKYTAAHRKLPFGTWVEVRRADTGRTVRVRINDRGPWGNDRRIIDLSRKAAEDLDVVREGVAKVELRVVSGP